MRVRDIMETEVLTLDLGDTLDLADDVMRLGRIRHLPILEKGRLVGVVSQRDLFRASISSVLQFRAAAEREWLAKIQIRELLRERDMGRGDAPRVIAIDPDASVAEAVDLMLRERIGCLPVLREHRLIGLLSETDCLRYLARLLVLDGEKQRLPELPKAT